MMMKVLLAVSLTVALGIAPTHAQQGSGASALQPSTAQPALTRVPALGDKPRVQRPPRSRRAARASQLPSSQNGNAPDRAAAGAR